MTDERMIQKITELNGRSDNQLHAIILLFILIITPIKPLTVTPLSHHSSCHVSNSAKITRMDPKAM